ncbi:MAG: 4Fe-4S binding protein [Phycisphaerae bacterium]|nr:4Fe-4S binding protein [Phycisphaerae bacterium]
MPWVNQEMCTGCGICVRECPVDAMEQQADGRALIREDECIRCGKCHDVCPRNAVRHDSERIPLEVAQNLQWVQTLLKNFSTQEEQAAFMERMGRYFKKQIKVGERTLEVVSQAKSDFSGVLDAAMRALRIPENH